MKKFLLRMLSDGSEISVKRVITFGSFLLISLAYLLDLFFSITVDDKLTSVMEALVMSGFAGTVLEKFAPKPKDKDVIDADLEVK